MQEDEQENLSAKPSHFFIMNPNSNVRILWDVVILVAGLIECVSGAACTGIWRWVRGESQIIYALEVPFARDYDYVQRYYSVFPSRLSTGLFDILNASCQDEMEGCDSGPGLGRLNRIQE